jgi:hypothetical protein
VNVDDEVALLILCCAIAWLIFLFYNLWSRLVVDRMRQRLFESRDALFDMAANGEIPFSNPVYLTLRHRINLMIRFCHLYKFGNLLAITLMLRGRSEHPFRFETTLKQIEDPRLRDKLRSIHRRTLITVLNGAVGRSALLLSVFLVDRSWLGKKISRLAGRLSVKFDDELASEERLQAAKEPAAQPQHN